MPPQLSEKWLNILVQPPKDLLEAKIFMTVYFRGRIFKGSEMDYGPDALAFM
ncbi:uncharacterized protein METZ01_LOCUS327581, partial [marine metagenome]